VKFGTRNLQFGTRARFSSARGTLPGECSPRCPPCPRGGEVGCEPLWDTGTSRFSATTRRPVKWRRGATAYSRSATASSGRGPRRHRRDAGDRVTSAADPGARAAAHRRTARRDSSSRSGTRILNPCLPTTGPSRDASRRMNGRGEYAAFTPGRRRRSGPGTKAANTRRPRNILATGGREQHESRVREPPGHLSQRLVAALEGASAAAGDTRVSSRRRSSSSEGLTASG